MSVIRYRFKSSEAAVGSVPCANACMSVQAIKRAIYEQHFARAVYVDALDLVNPETGRQLADADLVAPGATLVVLRRPGNKTRPSYLPAPTVHTTKRTGPVPDTHTCKRCGARGEHFVEQCAVPLIPDTIVARPSLQMQQPGFNSAAASSPSPPVSQDLQCRICLRLLDDAVDSACCHGPCCDACLREAVLASPDLQCPLCGAAGCCLDMVLPNYHLRAAVDKFRRQALRDTISQRYAPDETPAEKALWMAEKAKRFGGTLPIWERHVCWDCNMHGGHQSMCKSRSKLRASPSKKMRDSARDRSRPLPVKLEAE